MKPRRLGAALGVALIVAVSFVAALPAARQDDLADINAEATGPGGAIVGFNIGHEWTCDPGSGSLFPIGTTQVGCSMFDPVSHKGASASFRVIVSDSKPPVITTPASTTTEATSKAGAPVSYPPVTAVDLVDGNTPVTCSPSSGAVFPIGQTSVRCTAVDSHGNSGTVTFAVTVQDTKAPSFGAATPVVKHVDGVASVRISFTAPAANDAIDGVIKATCTPASGSLFRLGSTTVTCTAKDAHGNTATTSFRVQVLDTTAPPQVVGLALHQASDSVTLTWRRPAGKDFASVVVLRSPGVSGAKSTAVYTGSGTSFTDKSVKAGVKYQYVVISVDHAGNRSAGLSAAAPGSSTPAVPSAIVAPLDGARVTTPPLLQWKSVPKADYYNVQLFLDGSKVLSIWPMTNELRLATAWVYAGKRHQLTPGTYRWYVWPGFGPLASAKYGKLLGTSTFVVSG